MGSLTTASPTASISAHTRSLPCTPPPPTQVEKAIKIALDQLVFSSLCECGSAPTGREPPLVTPARHPHPLLWGPADLGVFFLGVGCMMGGVDKLVADSRAHGIDDVEVLLAKQRASAARRAAGLEKELLALRDGGSGASGDSAESADPATAESIDRVLALLREEKAKAASVTWLHIWEHTVEHTKQVYLPTYIAGAQGCLSLCVRWGVWGESVSGIALLLRRCRHCRLHRVAPASAH